MSQAAYGREERGRRGGRHCRHSSRAKDDSNGSEPALRGGGINDLAHREPADFTDLHRADEDRGRTVGDRLDASRRTRPALRARLPRCHPRWHGYPARDRSAERRVWKECVSTYRSRSSPYISKKLTKPYRHTNITY